MKFFAYTFFLVTTVLADYATYPSVPKTASINGFADPIKDLLPECATDCVSFSTSNTPCPYWDTGCLCVMPQWSGQVGSCFAASCSGSDLALATALAYSLCTRVGANLWLMPASVSAAISSAADGVVISLSATPADLVSLTDSSAVSTTSGGSSSLGSGSASGSNSIGSSGSGISSTTANSTSASSSSRSTSTNGALKKSANVFGGLLAALLLMLS